MLRELVDNLGQKWSRIAKKFQGRRTEHMVKNRYQGLMRKERRNREALKEQNDSRVNMQSSMLVEGLGNSEKNESLL